MSITFTKATKKKQKLRIVLEGASGSGKTTAALTLARNFGKVAVIDTENGSASLYADQFDFDTINLQPPFEPERYVEAIKAAEDGGYDVVVIDSGSHEWMGPGGCLEIKEKLGREWQHWAKVNPRHDKFVQAILRSKIHVIMTCRSKQGYHMDEQTKKVTKVGMESQQRDGLDFEMSVVFMMNDKHMATATKDRTRLFDGRDAPITDETAQRIKDWLESGAEPTPAEKSLSAEVTQALVSGADALAKVKDLGPKLRAKDSAKADEILKQYKDDLAGMAKALEEALR